MSQPRITEILEKSFDSNAGTFAVQAENASLATTPVNAVVTLTSADTEYSYEFPTGTKQFTIYPRRGSETEYIRMAWETGKVAGSVDPYFELPASGFSSETGLNLTGKTVYLAGSHAGDVVQIQAWT